MKHTDTCDRTAETPRRHRHANSIAGRCRTAARLLAMLIAAVALTLPADLSAQRPIPSPTKEKSVKPTPKPTKSKKSRSSSNNKSRNKTTQSSPRAYRETCQNLDLYATLNGKSYFFTVKEWNALPKSVQSKFDRQGVVIKKDGQLFSLALHFSGQKMTWDDAMALYGDKLPTKEQGGAIVPQCDAVNAAIIAFGGDKDPYYNYWTRTEHDDSSRAWTVGRNGGHIKFNYSYKTDTHRIRLVAPVPGSSAM